MEEEKYKNLFLSMTLGVIYQDPTGFITDANPAAEEILGYTKDELANMTSNSPWDAIRPDGSPFPGDEHPAMLALKTKKEVREVIMGIIHPKKKKRVWLQIDALPEFKCGEQNPFRVYATFTDITDKFETDKRLHVSEIKFKALFENSPIGIAYHRMIYNEKGDPIDYFFLDANQHYLTLTGIDPRGKKVTEAFPGIENDPADWIGTFAKAGKYGKTIRFQQYLESIDRWYDAVGYQSSPDHFVATFLEITEQKKKEIELERLKNELELKVIERTKQLEVEKEKAEAANHAKSVFLANMSHELRTPLNAVLGYADILSSKEKDKSKIQYLNTISYSGKLLLNLINDILDLSKIEAGKLTLEYSAVSVRSIFEEISNLFYQKITDKGLVYNTEIDQRIPQFLIIDESRFRQIVINLVGNAIKFTKAGCINVRCNLLDDSNESCDEVNICIEIEDTGKGIEPDDFERIFQSFEQAKNQNSSDYEGTGLGLAITKQFIELMNGTISVRSEVGKGTTFTVIINGIEPALSSNKESKNLPNIIPENIVFEPTKILIVDDINYNRDLIAKYLEDYPFSIRMAENGKNALSLIESEKPDIVLLDMKMPVMDGYTLSKLLKEDPKYSDIVLIAITASSLADDEIIIKKYCNGFLRKPVLLIELVNELTHFISHQKLDINESQKIEQFVIPSLDILKTIVAMASNGDMDGIIEYVKIQCEKHSESESFFNYISQLANSCNEDKIHLEINKYLK